MRACVRVGVGVCGCACACACVCIERERVREMQETCMSQYDDTYAELAQIAAQTKGLYTSDKYSIEGLPEFFLNFSPFFVCRSQARHSLHRV